MDQYAKPEKQSGPKRKTRKTENRAAAFLGKNSIFPKQKFIQNLVLDIMNHL